MKRKSINWFRIRIILLSILLFFCFVAIVGRMFQLQVLKKEELYKLAAQQHHVQIPLVPKRGTIYDQKENELAVSIEVDSVYADPRRVTDVEGTASALARVLRMDRAELRKRLKSHRSFEWIRRKISSREAEEIKALQLPGIHFLKENQRCYPNAQLASHVIGFVGLDSKGLEGVEYQYDSLLNGGNRMWTRGRDALGREIVTGDRLLEKEDQHRNIFLTLDKHIQHMVETELSSAVQKWRARGGMAVAMDPQTGKVLAMACYPFFNPNQFLQYQSKFWRNRTITDSFEPGSLFKAFLAATALEEHVVRPSDSFFCENGAYAIYDRTIHDHTKYGWLTFQQIIKFSSNIGASKVGVKMGKDRFYRYIRAFGFGEKTGIDLPGEGRGIVHHPRYWPPVALGTISFGQGISVTAIQLATALSAIANGGFLMRPYVVEKITSEKGETIQSFQPEVIRRVISEETARKVAALLKATTEKGGTGEAAVPAGYEVAGKTGTAQKVDPVLGGYSEEHFISGFMGFAPAQDPKIVLVVVIDEPQGTAYGSVVAAPLFRAMMEKILPYLHIHPKGTLVVKKGPDAALGDQTSEPQSLGEDGKVGKTLEKAVMPDLTGLSMRKALSRIEGKGLIIKVSGNGKVVEQTPKAGIVIEKGDICYLKLQSSS
ncbi:MAG: transpeptidase family protein [Syntrophaceae bacterium]|nr:transpeptidase family protein [Syntrophaceae bacterium]